MILVIILDEKLRDDIIKTVLEPMDHEVLLASDEKGGAELALLHEPELILVDEQFWQHSNRSMMTILRHSNHTMPVVLVSDKECVCLIEDFKRGISDVISLPLDPTSAQQVIERAINDSYESRQRHINENKLMLDEAVRITMTTLSHYLNNYLTALDGDLTLLQEAQQNHEPVNRQSEILKKTKIDAALIKKVVEVLVNTTSIKLKEYDNSVTMIDIDTLLFNEINQILNAGAGDANEV
jgi:FixJ family two-component response regulator